MRAGSLVHVIEIQTFVVEGQDGFGGQLGRWVVRGTLRAEIASAEEGEAARAGGTSQTQATLFRTRFCDWITVADRVLFRGQVFDIKRVVPIGRRRWLEIHCLASPGGA